MIVYQVEDAGENGVGYYSTLRAAKAAAHAVAADVGQNVTVEKCEVVRITRHNLPDILKGSGWCARAEVVYTARAPRAES